jgi:hypothetical protein
MAEKVSKLKVMQSAAGYYIGRSYKDEDFGAELPYSRDSAEYYKTEDEAKNALKNRSFTQRDHY